MRITIVSGKGGVGKSMIASSLAILFSDRADVVALDCDVDAPNLGLWLGIDISKDAKYSKKISTIQKPTIDEEKCRQCKKCIKNCNFQALEMTYEKKVKVVTYRCEGCGLCEIICPEKAIELKPVYNCQLSQYDTKWKFPLIQGQIKPGEAESGEVVTRIREYAKKFVKEDTVIIQDAAAGIGCPIIASIKGSDLIIAIAEPSQSSFSDLKRVLTIGKHFKIPFRIIINKFDLNSDISKKIKAYANENYLGKISYDKKIIESIVNLKPIIGSKIKAEDEIEEIFSKLVKIL